MTPALRHAITDALAAIEALLDTGDVRTSDLLRVRAGLASALRESERTHFDAGPFSEPAEELFQRRAQRPSGGVVRGTERPPLLIEEPFPLPLGDPPADWEERLTEMRGEETDPLSPSCSVCEATSGVRMVLPTRGVSPALYLCGRCREGGR